LYNQALGCKTTGCFVGAIIVFAFFAYLIHSVQDMADTVKKNHSSPPPMGKMVDTDKIGSLEGSSVPGDSGDDAEATAEIINATRLPALLSAAQRYAKDHADSLPPMETPEALHAALSPTYVTGEGVFQSPDGNKPYLPNPSLSGKPLNSFSKPAEIIAFYEPLEPTEADKGKRRAVQFLDGSQRQVTAQEWDDLRKKAKLP
jgi:hypothetical protein